MLTIEELDAFRATPRCVRIDTDLDDHADTLEIRPSNVPSVAALDP